MTVPVSLLRAGRGSRTGAALLAVTLLAGCRSHLYTDTQAVLPAEPEDGRRLVAEYGCASCHRIPGVAQPSGQVGPPLGGLADRRVIAGVLPNIPENAVRWVQDPQDVNPQTLMPDLGVTEEDARDIVAYLYSLD